MRRPAFRPIVIVCLCVMYALRVHTAVADTLPLPYTAKGYELHSSRNTEASWKCSYPFFSGSVAALIINQSLLYAVTGVDSAKPHAPVSLQRSAALFISEFDDFLKDEPEAMPWFSNATGSVILNRSGLLTVGIASETYTGGAHGMETVTYYVYESTSGRRLTLDDIFLNGYRPILDQLIERRFRQDKGLKPSEPLDGDNGGLFENYIRHNDNFAITDRGIAFLYNPYEIAAYAYGQITVELKWAEIRTLVKRQYALM